MKVLQYYDSGKGCIAIKTTIHDEGHYDRRRYLGEGTTIRTLRLVPILTIDMATLFGLDSFPTWASGICTACTPSSSVSSGVTALSIRSVCSVRTISPIGSVGIRSTVLTVLWRGWAKCWRGGRVCRTRRRVYRASRRVRWGCRTELWTRWPICQLVSAQAEKRRTSTLATSPGMQPVMSASRRER